jgi:hypothetical protein
LWGITKERKHVMRWKLVTRPLLRSLVGLAALNGTAFVGCGSDVSSRPDLGTAEYESPVADHSRDRVASPTDFRAQAMPDCVRLSWGMPAVGNTAIIHCDGVEVATMDARTFQFDDKSLKAPGKYRYSVSFARGNSISRPVIKMVTILREPVRKDPGGNSLEDR